MHTDNHLVYDYSLLLVCGKIVGLVEDLAHEESCVVAPSVTNRIYDIAEEIGVESIIYKDSMGHWDFWSKQRGFLTLAQNGIPCKGTMEAIERATVRYLSETL